MHGPVRCSQYGRKVRSDATASQRAGVQRLAAAVRAWCRPRAERSYEQGGHEVRNGVPRVHLVSLLRHASNHGHVIRSASRTR